MIPATKLKYLDTFIRKIQIILLAVILSVIVIAEYSLFRKEQSRKVLSPGKIFPSIQLRSLTGKQLSFDELISGNTVLIVFSTTCSHCLDEIKFWEEYARNRKDTCRINALSIDNIADTYSFVNEQNIAFPVLTCVSIEVIDSLHIHAVPTTYFIDSKRILKKVIVGNQKKTNMFRMINEFFQVKDPGKGIER